MRKCLIFSSFLFFLAFFLSGQAQAQSAATVDTIIEQFQSQSKSWESTLTNIASNTFAILAAIEVSWAAMKLVFDKCDLSELMAEMLNQMLGLGFFWLLLKNASTWGTAIVNSYRIAGKSAGGVGISPADVFGAGVALGQKVLGHVSVWHPESSAAIMIAALVVCGAFFLIAAEMCLTVIQSYICISAGIINMAFGGSSWTRDIAISTIRYPVSVGAKLMVLQLIVSIGQNTIIGWADKFNDLTNESLLELIGGSILILALVKTLPSEFQRIVGGASLASGSGLIGAGMEVAAAGAAVAGGAASMAVNAAGAGAATWQAGSLASAQTANGSGSFAGNMAKNLGGAAMDEVGRRLRGDINSQHGHGTWRMATDMQGNRRRYVEDIEREKQEAAKAAPRPPENTIS